jgi:hypothetical protein
MRYNVQTGPMVCLLHFRYPNPTYPTKINYYSSPDLTAPNGQPTGVANVQDNKRTHMERKLAMSQLGDESVSCNVGTTTSTTPVDFRWNSAGPIEEMHCTQVITVMVPVLSIIYCLTNISCFR